jgi:holliday junction DNA helicase RuvA
MFEYISGKLVKLSPANATLDVSGIGYSIEISLNTYSILHGKNECQLFVHQVIREDAQLLFGFYKEIEREMFRQLISVSGVGANTARMMLSSMNTEEIRDAILTGNVALLQGIKGIGAKTAQRIIVDLKDKVGKASKDAEIFISQSNTIKEEALSALVALGFAKNVSDKTLSKVLAKEPNASVEELVKRALKQL